MWRRHTNQSHEVAENVLAPRGSVELDESVRVDFTRISHKEQRRTGRRHTEQSNEMVADITASHVCSQRDGSDREDVTRGIFEQQYNECNLTHAWFRSRQRVNGDEYRWR